MAYQSIFTNQNIPVRKGGGYQSIFQRAKPVTPIKPISPTSTNPTIKTLPDIGSFYNVPGLYTKPHTTYGGIPSQPGYQRDDIFPVALGGVNATSSNIKMMEENTADKFDAIEKKNIADYKAGRITLAAARSNVVNAKIPWILEQQGISQSVMKNLPSSMLSAAGQIAKGFISPFVSAGVSLVNQQRNIQSATKALITGKKTTQDYTDTSYNIPIYGKAEPLLTEKIKNPVEMTKQVVGNALEIAPYVMSAPVAKNLIKTIETIGKKPLQQITSKEAIQFAKAYGTKIAASSLGLGSMFGLGGSIKEGADLKTTTTNIAKSIGTIALLEMTLSPLITYGLKNIKGRTVKESVDKVIEDHKELIDQKAQEIVSKIPPTEPLKPLEPLKFGIKKPEIKPLETAQIEPIKPEVGNLPIEGQKVSGVAKQIEAKAIEEGMTKKGYAELAEYDASTIKEQSEMASKYSSEQINRIATGKELLPERMKAGTALSIAEDYAIKTKDGQLALELAKSPLVTQLSESASELSLSRMRESAISGIQEVIKNKEQIIEKRSGKTIKELKNKVIKEIKNEVIKKTPTRETWLSFIESIKC